MKRGLPNLPWLFWGSVLCFLGFGLSFSEELKKDPAVLNYEPSQVVLKGKVTTRLEYGAPGFGEDPKNDAKENIFLLVLDKPVDVQPDPDLSSDTNTESFKNVREMQMVFMNIDHKLFKRIMGKKVKVTGTLFQAETGHHHTDVLVTVDELKILN